MKPTPFLTIALLLAVLLMSGCYDTDQYYPTDHDTPRDLECEEAGKRILEEQGVHYPEGFICESWLSEESYFSKSKCSCYRGRSGQMEVVTYYRSSGEIIRINSNVRFKEDEDISQE